MTNVICNEEIPDWEYAKRGIDMWLNNNPQRAEEYFKVKLERTKVFSSYTFTTVMNAVISCELDKINIAQELLREVERRCTPPAGWMQTLKLRIFGRDMSNARVDADALEERIIAADALLCSALLTFLTQDISGLMKGSWLLRRAWKMYEQLYAQIYNLYKNAIQLDAESQNPLQPVTPANLGIETATSTQQILPHGNNSFNAPRRNGFKKTSDGENNTPCHFMKRIPPSVSYVLPTETLNSYVSNRKNKHSSTTGVAKDPAAKCSSKDLFLDLLSSQNYRFHQVSLSCPDPVPSPKNEALGYLVSNDVELSTAKRLMGAVSFGFGILQLSVSLLPPSLLKIISFLGFKGNREMGIACLNYTRKTEDMRAPLATLAMLWYFTIGSQLFHGDDANMPAEIEATRLLLKDSRPQYTKSAIFLFFHARLKRLQCKTSVAIELYDAAYRMSAQRELKMLCLHEVGWCRLIHLDYGNAMLHFHELKQVSSFSRSFYAYMTAICQGAFGRFESLITLRAEILKMTRKNNCKETQIDKFILRRVNKIPSSDSDRKMFHVQYWKFFIYEMLFLWNTLHSCPTEVLITIISDCSHPIAHCNEPSVGLALLILGVCKIQLRQYEIAAAHLRECIEKRSSTGDDVYISAYAKYELGTILMKQARQDDIEEARSLLLDVQSLYKNYDFENRLSARVFAMLKHM